MKEPEIVVAQYGDMVYRLAYARTHNRSDADDIFQEVFLRYIRRKPEFESEEHGKAWLIRVTLNCAKTHWLHLRRAEPLDEQIPFIEPEDSGLDAALAKLPEKSRIAVHLYYFEGCSAEEIAKLMKEKPSTVRTRLTRARQKLRQLMQEMYEEASI